MTEEERNDWLESLQLDKRLRAAQLTNIENSEKRAAIEHEQVVALNADSLAACSPEAKREWQRHCVAIAMAQGLLIREGDTRLPVGPDIELVKHAYELAELMMQERESRK